MPYARCSSVLSASSSPYLIIGAEEITQGLGPHLRTARFGLRMGHANTKSDNEGGRTEKRRRFEGLEMSEGRRRKRRNADAREVRGP